MSEHAEYRIIFGTANGQVETTARAGEFLLDVARKVNVAIDAPCSGNGTCGKCRVILKSGELTSAPGAHLSAKLYDEGYRLACVSEVSGDCEVEVPESAIAFQTKIRTTDCSSPDIIAKYAEIKQLYAVEDLAGGQQVGVLEIQVSEPSLDDPEADLERVKRGAAASLGIDAELIRFSLLSLANLPKILRDNSYKVYLTYRKELSGNYTILRTNADDEHPIGAAVDIGTTTVSLLLVDLLTGEVLSSGSAGNGQIRFGADVINRLIESGKKGGVERLRKAVTDECIAPLISAVTSKISRDASDVIRIAITGNTTMIHLLLGVYGDFLRQEPYVPAFFNAHDFAGHDLSLPIHPDATVIIAPSVGSYVGGDITAGAMIAGVSGKPGFSLFVDLGTNGEIVFGSQDFMMTCACSAGPAFEGGDISCGMRATDGAIEAISISQDTMEPTLTIIGEASQKPVGICGSGLIDLVSELFRTRIVDAKGKFIRESERIKKDEWDITRYIVAAASETENGEEIYISDADIDNFIRAKGSIFSAIRTMLLMTDMEIDFIEDIYIAGGIGSGIDFDKAISIGMLPDIDRSHYHYIGNTSLNGAYCMLLSDAAVAKVDAIAGGMTYVELSSYPAYMDEFIAACFLPHTDASLFST